MCASSAKGHPVKQRADLTFKHNISEERHGWLRLTPAHSVKIVEQVLSRHQKPISVLDPFSGTATTPLCAATHGHSAISVDINPFLVWFGETKVAEYDGETIARAREVAAKIGKVVEAESVSPVAPPPIANINRWWDEKKLDYLWLLKAAIALHDIETDEIQNLLKIAFCKTLIEVSNAAFNHQSMSFKDKQKSNGQQKLWNDEMLGIDSFSENIDMVLRSAELNPVGEARVMLGDSRSLEFLGEQCFEFLITSPPYPNRMSYIRELRPYMYWLGYLKEAREAGELDWKAIGGTWGIATSRLNDWRRDEENYCPDNLLAIIKNISKEDSKSGPLLANYVGKYFEDMWLHFKSVKKCMKPGAEVHYIVGNSKFYDFLVPVETIYADMLTKAGFIKANIEVVRKRNSKKELYEFDVTAIA
jgi:hypothetical protein